MPTTNTNDTYLSIGGVDFSDYFVSVEISQTNNAVEVTTGHAQTDVQRLPGLNDRTLTATIRSDTGFDTTELTPLIVGTQQTVSYGPEGNTSGLPKFEGSMILTQIDGPSANVNKDVHSLELTLTQADVPTATIENGDTFA